MPKSPKQNISLKMTVALAMLAAISIILGKYLAIPVGNVLRFSFENLPIIFAGVAFGAFPAMLVAIIADILGCILVSYPINPIVTLGAAIIGVVAGITPRLVKKLTPLSQTPLVIITVALSHLCGSVLIKTFGLAVYYDMPIPLLMMWRLLNYAVVGALEIIIISILLKRESVRQEIDKFKLKSK